MNFSAPRPWQENREEGFFRWDPHRNARGHERVAEHLEAAIRELRNEPATK